MQPFTDLVGFGGCWDGVDPTAFQSGPTTRTDVAAASRVTDQVRQVDLDGVAVWLTRMDSHMSPIATRTAVAHLAKVRSR